MGRERGSGALKGGRKSGGAISGRLSLTAPRSRAPPPAYANSRSLSTITLLWSASKGAKALRLGLNAAYALRETRSPLAVELISVVSGLIMDVLIAATVYLVFNGSALRLLANVIPGLRGHDVVMDVLNSLGTMAIGAICLSACYAYLPAGRRSLVAQLPGAVCATLACAALSFGFRVYVDNFSNFTMLYGSIATIALLLFWMYLVSYIFIAGGHSQPAARARARC